jgi:hypothetical protein
MCLLERDHFISLAVATRAVLNSIPKPDDDPVLEKGEDGWTKLPRQNPSSPKFASLGGNKSDAVQALENANSNPTDESENPQRTEDVKEADARRIARTNAV